MDFSSIAKPRNKARPLICSEVEFFMSMTPRSSYFASWLRSPLYDFLIPDYSCCSFTIMNLFDEVQDIRSPTKSIFPKAIVAFSPDAVFSARAVSKAVQSSLQRQKFQSLKQFILHTYISSNDPQICRLADFVQGGRAAT